MKDFSNLILYKASAGSGKTYTLAKEFLKLVIVNPYDYNKILAVTFTKKATAEMKSRIIEYLTLLEAKDTSVILLRNTIIKEVAETLNIDITHKFDSHVSLALQLILHDYSNFNISTIDSFFQSIVRSFAKELDLPMAMEVELDTNSVLQYAVQAMLKDYRSDSGAFSKWIEAYAFNQIEDGKSWKIENNIQKMATQLLSESYAISNTFEEDTFDIAIYKDVLTELKQIIKQYKSEMDALVSTFEKNILDQHIDLSLFKGASTIPSFVKKTKSYAPEVTDTISKMIYNDEILSAENLKKISIKTQTEAAWQTLVKPFLLDVLAYQRRYEKKYYAAEIVLKGIYSFALLEYINTKIKAYKLERNLILISDTNQLISLIAEHEEVPFIFEKAAVFLKYILIDEFQDTSALQWKGILPLLQEILQQASGVVLIVGDPKQSIYRWRGGKMELIIDGVAAGLPLQWKNRKDEPLTDNWRSAKEIIEFNNAFFTKIKETVKLENPIFEKVLADVNQNIKKEDKNGYVECRWLEKNQDEDLHLTAVLDIIRTQGENRKYSDFAVLTRNNAHGAGVANFLQLHQIPVVSAESLLLKSQIDIQVLIAAIEYIVHPSENFYAVKLNYLYAKYLKKEDLASYLIKQKNDLYFFEDNIEALKKHKLQTLATLAINELIFRLMQLLKLDINTNNYLLRFQDIVFKYVQKFDATPRSFLMYWDEQKDKLSIVPPEGIDAVQIYTIHKSKGLQFPIVIVPYANWSMNIKQDSNIWIKNNEVPFNALGAFPIELSKKAGRSIFEEEFKKEQELTYIDNINLLYVAFTRPEEQLYILSNAISESKKKKNEEETPSVNKLLHGVLPKLALNNATNNTQLFSYGNRLNPEKKQENTTPEITLAPVPFHPFKENILLANKKEYNEAQTRGNLIHEILSKINHPTQLHNAVLATAPDNIDEYLKIAQNIIDLFIQKGWFDAQWQNMNERNIIFNGKLLRADRVLISHTECVIIDYKTGAAETEHAKQLTAYKNAYATLLNKKTSAYLLYIEPLLIKEIL